jgi:oligopeptide/dipeptide ABC transporter ATP-binding protein
MATVAATLAAEPGTSASAAPVTPLLDVRDLRTWFHVMDGTVKAVDGISFSIGPGRTLGVVGESGCGKSVTALTIMRLLDIPPAEIASGQILFEGRDLLKLSEDEVRKLRGFEMAMIFQEPMTSLNPVFRVGDQVAEAIAQHLPVTKQEAADRAVEALRRVGISYPERRARQYPHELSGGMRQRVMIAMGLSCEPKLLIADEPTTALDVTIQAQILELIKELQEQTGAALMLITHDLGVVAEMVDEVMVMYAGRVVEHGTAEEVLLAPRHPYTEGLLASIPSRGMRGQRLNVIQGAVPNPFNMPAGCNFAPRCPYRFEPCAVHDPRLGEVDGRRVACWRWLEPPAVEPPPVAADGQPLPDATPPSEDPALLEPDPVIAALSPDEPARDAVPIDPEEAGPRIGA